MGASFAYIPMLISLGSRFDLPTIFGAQLVGGAVAILVGVFYKKINALFPPIVTGTVVFTIGLSLYPTAVNYMAGGTGAADFGSPLNWAIALFTLGVVLFCNHFTKGITKMASILIGMACGYVLALCWERFPSRPSRRRAGFRSRHRCILALNLNSPRSYR